MPLPKSLRPDLAPESPVRVTDLLHTLRTWPWLDTVRTLRERFREDRLGLTAGSLSFQTLIALVPLLTVMLALFTAFPVFGKFQGALEKYFLQALVPEGIARPVLNMLTQFAAKASRVGSVGLLLLVATALALMLTIDRTLNAIWRVRRPRPVAQRILVYWAALTLGPLAVGVSLSVTSLAVSASRGLVSALPGGVTVVFDLLQFLLLAAATAGLFRYVPNTAVRWRHAGAGGLFVAVGMEFAKKILAWYVDSMATFSAVYGAFATLPILLLWIYLAWVIMLLGAQVAASAPSLGLHLRRLPDRPGARFALALTLLQRLRQARAGASAGLTLHELAAGLHLDPLQVEPVLDRLEELSLVGRLDEAGLQRHVLLGEPASQPARPLVEALLLAPDPAVQALQREAGFERLTLQDLLPR